jgi:hypothetical protein
MKTLEIKFLESLPEELEEGILYISMKFKAARHKCACGCGRLVITPITPTDWQLKYNGKSITLEPSIGNWGFPCQSHYWIIKSEIRWAKQWDKKQVVEGIAKDSANKKQYYKKGKDKNTSRFKGFLSFLKSLF